MPILKEIQAPNGIRVSYHALGGASIDVPLGVVRLSISSYPSEEAAMQGLPRACSFNDLSFPLAVVVVGEDGVVGALEQVLVGQDGGARQNPFFGGIIVTDQTGTVQAARDRAWAAVKAARAIAEEGSFAFDGGSYQADKLRITGAVQLATLAKTAGAPFSETWTLTDNTTRELDADQVIALGMALGQYVSSLYATGRALRAEIDAAETIDAVTAVRWPA